MASLKDRLAEIESRIASSCDLCGRDRSSVTLIAVSKTVSVDHLKAAYDLGVRNFGESRLQEALPKIEQMPGDAVWHFIGKLQSNKARKVGENFQVVHTLENEGQMRELEKAGKPIDALVEVNVSREEQKAGVFAESLDSVLKTLSSYNYVHFRGLMTIGPLTTDLEQSRQVFRALKDLGQSVGADWLSMGMSADYDVAIQEGATHVRVGSALFGDRG